MDAAAIARRLLFPVTYLRDEAVFIDAFVSCFIASVGGSGNVAG